MPTLFETFDFALLDDPAFREDSVREELIVPLLAALGYTAAPPNRIVRSRKLEHPFVHIGSARKGITIIPDYLLEREGENAWILDAKSPSENINSGKNVEQAYSYAIHRDIRAPLYGLCNGHKLVVWHVSQLEPVIDVALIDINRVWPLALDLLGCRSAWPMGVRPGFLPDMGIAMTKAGLVKDDDGKKYWQMFMQVEPSFVVKLTDDQYCITAAYQPLNNPAFMLTFDFSRATYDKLLLALSPKHREQVQSALSRQPWQMVFDDEDRPVLTVAGEIGDQICINRNESYLPFVAEDFLPDSHEPI